MQIAGINFKILGTEEKCTGDPARRNGATSILAQTLIKDNIETLNRYNVKKIVTTCRIASMLLRTSGEISVAIMK